MSDILSTASLVGIQQQLYDIEMQNRSANKNSGGLTKWQEDEIVKMITDARKKVKDLQETVADYENMLTMPMMELAKKTGKFAETYLLQQETMARWILTQRSWKKLAIEKMKRDGMTDEQIENEFQETKKDIIDEVGEKNGRVKFFKEKLLEENK